MLRQIKINELTAKINKYKQDLPVDEVKYYVEKITNRTFPEWDQYVKSADALYKKADVPYTHNEVTYTYDVLLQLEKRYMYIHRHINTYNPDNNEVRICISENLKVELSEIENIYHKECVFTNNLFNIYRRYDSDELLDLIQGRGLSVFEKKIIYCICAYGQKNKDIDDYFAHHADSELGSCEEDSEQGSCEEDSDHN